MNIFVVVIFAAVIIGLVVFVRHGHKKAVRGKIEQELGGELELMERRNFFTGIGPFNVIGKNRVIYRVIYRVGGQKTGVKKEIWVRFGGWGGAEWRE